MGEDVFYLYLHHTLWCGLAGCNNGPPALILILIQRQTQRPVRPLNSNQIQLEMKTTLLLGVSVDAGFCSTGMCPAA